MTEIACHACGRPLRDPASVESGVGPTCAARARPPAEILFRAEWFSERIGDVLVLFDRDCGSMSLTNDVDRVLLEEARRRGSLPGVVLYRDSTGRYDRIRHRNGVFGGFAPLGATSLDAALQQVGRQVA